MNRYFLLLFLVLTGVTQTHLSNAQSFVLRPQKQANQAFRSDSIQLSSVERIEANLDDSETTVSIRLHNSSYNSIVYNGRQFFLSQREGEVYTGSFSVSVNSNHKLEVEILKDSENKGIQYRDQIIVEY